MASELGARGTVTVAAMPLTTARGALHIHVMNAVTLEAREAVIEAASNSPRCSH